MNRLHYPAPIMNCAKQFMNTNSDNSLNVQRISHSGLTSTLQVLPHLIPIIPYGLSIGIIHILQMQRPSLNEDNECVQCHITIIVGSAFKPRQLVSDASTLSTQTRWLSHLTGVRFIEKQDSLTGKKLKILMEHPGVRSPASQTKEPPFFIIPTSYHPKADFPLEIESLAQASNKPRLQRY